MKVPYHTHPFKRHRHIHRHKMKMPGYNHLYTEPDEALPGYDPISFDDTMETGLYDEETADIFDDIGGFLGGVTGVVGDVTGLSTAAKGLGQVLGLVDEPKKKKDKAPDLSALAGMMQPQAPTIVTPPAVPGISPTEVQYIVKDLLGSISPPVRQKVREVVNEMKGKDASQENLIATIEQRVGSNVMPILNKAIEALKLAQTQTDATSEHRSIVRDQDRWRETMNNQQQLMNRIVTMEKRIAKALKNKKK